MFKKNILVPAAFAAICMLFFASCSEPNVGRISLSSNINESQQTMEKTMQTAAIKLRTGVINNAQTGRKIVALTFDADMTPFMLSELHAQKVKSWYDSNITGILEENSVPATVFVTGLWAQTYPDVLKKLAANPLYEIGNHTWDHAAFKIPCFGLAQAKNKQDEIDATQKIIKDLTGLTPKYFRFPGGCSDDKDVSLVNDSGLEVIGWDVVSGDSFLRAKGDEKKIAAAVLKQTKNGSIIVMHFNGGPNAPNTAAALPMIINGLKKSGFSFVTVSELLSN